MDLQPDPPSSITRSLPENDAVARLVLELLSGTEDRVRTPLSDLIEKVERLAGSELSRAGRDAAGEVLFSGRALLRTPYFADALRRSLGRVKARSHGKLPGQWGQLDLVRTLRRRCCPRCRCGARVR